jgi:hypothetical protein
MTRRTDSKIDLDKYRPSPDTVRRVSDEAAAQQRLRQALDNPALDAALAELQGGAPAPGAPEVPVAQAADAAPVLGPREASPWASGPGAGSVDAAALPSAMAPAAPPVTARLIAGGQTPPRARWTPARSALAAIALAFLPAMIVFLLFVRPPQPPGAPRDAPALASVAVGTATMPAPPVEPGASSRAASAGATSSASAEPAASPSATGLSSGTAPPRPRPRGTVDDPYDAAPPAAPSPATAPPAEPRPPPPASATPTAPTSDSPFLRKRPE